MNVNKVRKAVIPAAGLGTRFLPATKAQPKEMLPIIDKPAIQYIVEEAVKSGIDEILIVTGRNKRSIEDHFDRAMELEMNLRAKGKFDLLKMINQLSEVRIHYVRQKEPKGLGHAVLCAKQFVGNEPFAVLLGDDIIDATIPCLKQLLEIYKEYPSTILGVQEVDVESVSKYGIIKPVTLKKNVWQAIDLIEKPSMDKAPSRLAVLGRYILEPEIFNVLEKTKVGEENEIQLTDALRILAKEQRVYAYNFNGQRFDIGDKNGYLEATVKFALKRHDLRDKFLSFLKHEAKAIMGNL